MATTPIDLVVVQALLRAVGLVEVKQDDKPEEGAWQSGWLGGPLPHSKEALQGPAGRKGLYRALAGSDKPRVRGLLPFDAKLHPEPKGGAPLGLGSWLSFHDKLPVDLVLDPTDQALGLGIGVRAVKADGTPWFVVLVRIAEVAVGDPLTPSAPKTLARLQEPLALEGHVILPETAFLSRVGLVAKFDPAKPETFSALLDVGDRRGRSTRVAFPKTPKGSAVAPPLAALFAVFKAFVVSKVVALEKAEEAGAPKSPDDTFRRLEQHLFPLFDGTAPIAALSADVLGFDQPNACRDALAAWLKGLLPKPGTTLLNLNLDAASAALSHLRALFFGVSADKAPPITSGSWCAWVEQDKDLGSFLANVGLVLDHDSAGDVLSLGVRARVRKKPSSSSDPDVSLELHLGLLQVRGAALDTKPSLRAALSVRAPEGSPAPGGMTRVELGIAFDGALTPHVAVFLGESKRLLQGRDDSELLAKLTELGRLATTGLWQQVSGFAAAFFAAPSLDAVGAQALTGLVPGRFLEASIFAEARALLGLAASGDLAIALPLGTLTLTSSGLTLALPSTLLSGSGSLTAAGASLSLDLQVSGPTDLPFDVSAHVGVFAQGAFSIAVKLSKTGLQETLLPLLGSGSAPSFPQAARLLWPAIKGVLPAEATKLLQTIGLVDAGGDLSLASSGDTFATVGWDLLIGLANHGIPDAKITGDGGKPELSLVRSDTELGLALTKLDTATEGVWAGITALTLGVAKKGTSGWALAPSLGGQVRLDAAGSADEPLFASDFLYLDRASLATDITVIGIDAAGAFLPPSLKSATLSLRDLRLPFGGSKKGGASIEQGLLAKDGKNPGISLDVGWTHPDRLTLAFPEGSTEASKLPSGDAYAIALPINRRIGPLDVGSVFVGISTAETTDPKSASVHVVFEAAFDLGGVRIEPEGLGVRIPFKTLAAPETWEVSLDGLGLSFKSGGVTLAGRFAKVADGFEGDALVEAFGFSLGAIGAYSQVDVGFGKTEPSLYVFAVCKTPLGGPPFFFITGVAGGFGVNRLLERSADPRQIRNHPLLALMTGNVTEGRKYLSQLRPQPGAYWLAGGVNFLSFGLIQGSALLYVLFDRGFEIGVMAVASVAIPSLAQVNIGIDAGFTTRGETTLWARGALFDSWLLFEDCQLTGGFALQVWPDAGEAVVSIGGYGPLYKKPPRYPDVELLGLKWESGALVAKGGVYFAMTPREAMAGVQIEVAGKWGPIAAGFNAEVHGLLGWDPFHFEVLATVGIWGAFGSLRFEVGVGLHLYGPPIGGRATIKLLVVSASVSFGAGKPTFPEFIDVPKLLRQQLSLTPASQTSSRVVLSQDTLWGAAGEEKPSAFALAVLAGRAGDRDAAMPADVATPLLTTAEPIFTLKTRLPFDRVTGNMAAPPVFKPVDDLYLGPSGRSVSASELSVAWPKALAYGSVQLTPRELALEAIASGQPKALFGPSDAYAQGTSEGASADTMAEVYTSLQADGRAPEAPALPDVPRDVELSDAARRLDLPFASAWTASDALRAAEKGLVDGVTKIAKSGGSGTRKAEKVGDRWGKAPAPPLAYRPLSNQVLFAAARKAQRLARPKPPVPKAALVSIRSLDQTLRTSAFVATRVTAEGVRRVAPPTSAPRSLAVAQVALRVTAPPSLDWSAARPSMPTPAAAVHQRLAALSPGLVLPAPTGAHRSAALSVGAVFGDAPLVARLAAGEAAFFRVAEPGSLPAAPFALRLRGDMPVRLLACDGSGMPLSDEELWPSDERVLLPRLATRVVVVGLGRASAAQRQPTPTVEPPHVEEAPPQDEPARAPEEPPSPSPARAVLPGKRLIPGLRIDRVAPPAATASRPHAPQIPSRIAPAPERIAPAPERPAPTKISLPLGRLAERGWLPLRPARRPRPTGREAEALREAIRGAQPGAPGPAPRAAAPLESAAGLGPTTELLPLGRTTFLAPGCTVSVPEGLAARATELTTLRGAELLPQVSSIDVTLPASEGTLVVGVTLPEAPEGPLRESLRLTTGGAPLPLASVVLVGDYALVLASFRPLEDAPLRVEVRGGYRIRSVALIPMGLEQATRTTSENPARELVLGDLTGREGTVEIELEVR